MSCYTAFRPMTSRGVFVISLIGLFPGVVSSQDAGNHASGKSGLPLSRTSAHVGSSPDAPPPATDHLFVADTGPGLDTGCADRKQSPLIIQIPITRVVGDVAADGTLLDPQGLVDRNIVSALATLVLPAYDVDYDTPIPAPYQPERDRIRLNGNDIGPAGSVAYLTGRNNVWTQNGFHVPISMVRFGKRNPGADPTPGINEIRIDIDVANPPNNFEDWCTSVDWVYIRFDALAPVIMVHGNNSSGRFFDGLVDSAPPSTEVVDISPGVTKAFQQGRIQYDNSISMVTNTIVNHGNQLKDLIPAKAKEFGADWVHLVAHSKGGLDSRQFLASTIPPTLGVLSLTTLSTPHHGSPGADYQIDSVTASIADSDDSTRVALAQQVPPDTCPTCGTYNLRVSFVERFNERNIPLLPMAFTIKGETHFIKYQAVSADANLDGSHTVFGNPTITFLETIGLPGQGFIPSTAWAYIMEQIYRLLGNVSSARYSIEHVGNPPDDHIILAVRETPTTSFRTNDICVTAFSAQIDPFVLLLATLANHSTISNPAIGQVVVDSIKAIQPIQ